MLSIRCPVHDTRDLGRLSWGPGRLPLLPEDRDFCLCPPSPIRDFLQGAREPLTLEEQQQEDRKWEREFRRDSDEEFCLEQARIEALLRKYWKKKRRC